MIRPSNKSCRTTLMFCDDSFTLMKLTAEPKIIRAFVASDWFFHMPKDEFRKDLIVYFLLILLLILCKIYLMIHQVNFMNDKKSWIQFFFTLMLCLQNNTVAFCSLHGKWFTYICQWNYTLSRNISRSMCVNKKCDNFKPKEPPVFKKKTDNTTTTVTNLLS